VDGEYGQVTAMTRFRGGSAAGASHGTRRADRRLHLAGALVLPALLGAVELGRAGAAGVERPASGAPPPVTIEWSAEPLVSSGPNPLPVLVKDFEKDYPSIKVMLVPASNESQLDSAIGGGQTTPDVFSGDVTWAAEFGSGGSAAALTNQLPRGFLAGFAPGLVKGATYKGQVFAVPFVGDEGLLYYRSDLLAKNHLGVPSTWQQLESEAKRLERDGEVKYGFVWEGARYEGLTDDFTEILADAGGTVLDAAGTASALDSPAALSALSFMRSLITSGVSPAAVTGYEESQALIEFEDGNAAFLRNWYYAWPMLQSKGSKVAGDVGVAPLPTFAGRTTPGYSSIGGSYLYANPHSKHLQADLTLLTWLGGTAAQQILATQFSLIPTNEAVRQEKSVAAVNPVLAAVPKTRVDSPAETPQYDGVSAAIFDNVNAALTGAMSPSAALHAASVAIAKEVGASHS
jgi:multiple sugar transport system substrate-binding protein